MSRGMKDRKIARERQRRKREREGEREISQDREREREISLPLVSFLCRSLSLCNEESCMANVCECVRRVVVCVCECVFIHRNSVMGHGTTERHGTVRISTEQWQWATAQSVTSVYWRSGNL